MERKKEHYHCQWDVMIQANNIPCLSCCDAFVHGIITSHCFSTKLAFGRGVFEIPAPCQHKVQNAPRGAVQLYIYIYICSLNYTNVIVGRNTLAFALFSSQLSLTLLKLFHDGRLLCIINVAKAFLKIRIKALEDNHEIIPFVFY